jgi:hypothetical protein
MLDRRTASSKRHPDPISDLADREVRSVLDRLDRMGAAGRRDQTG